MGCFACRASKVFLLFFCSRHEVQVTFPQVTVKVTTLEINKQQVSPNRVFCLEIRAKIEGNLCSWVRVVY